MLWHVIWCWTALCNKALFEFVLSCSKCVGIKCLFTIRHCFNFLSTWESHWLWCSEQCSLCQNWFKMWNLVFQQPLAYRTYSVCISQRREARFEKMHLYCRDVPQGFALSPYGLSMSRHWEAELQQRLGLGRVSYSHSSTRQSLCTASCLSGSWLEQAADFPISSKTRGGLGAFAPAVKLFLLIREL